MLQRAPALLFATIAPPRGAAQRQNSSSSKDEHTRVRRRNSMLWDWGLARTHAPLLRKRSSMFGVAASRAFGTMNTECARI